MRTFDLTPITDLFDKDFWGMIPPMPPMPKEFKPFMGSMKTDITNGEKEYTVEIDLPGYNKEDVTIEIKDDVLEISAKKDETKEEGKEYIRKERFVASCSRRIAIPENVDVDAIKAKLENGVLRLTLPKVEPEEPETPPTKTVNVE